MTLTAHEPAFIEFIQNFARQLACDDDLVVLVLRLRVDVVELEHRGDGGAIHGDDLVDRPFAPGASVALVLEQSTASSASVQGIHPKAELLVNCSRLDSKPEIALAETSKAVHQENFGRFGPLSERKIERLVKAKMTEIGA